MSLFRADVAVLWYHKWPRHHLFFSYLLRVWLHFFFLSHPNMVIRAWLNGFQWNAVIGIICSKVSFITITIKEFKIEKARGEGQESGHWTHESRGVSVMRKRGLEGGGWLFESQTDPFTTLSNVILWSISEKLLLYNLSGTLYITILIYNYLLYER